MRQITAFALIVRIAIALSTRTFFQPDEYFQSLEPAHHIVFGYGQLTWEWLATRPIRSVLYPTLNVPIYWFLKVSGLDNGWLLIALPRAMHGALGAITDVWVGELAHKVLGKRYASTAVFLSLTSFFHALALSRSLSNSLETSVTVVAVSYYPWDLSTIDRKRIRPSIRTALGLAALACAVRPTNAVIWMYLLVALLWRLRGHYDLIAGILFDAAMIGTLALGFLFTIDSIYFQAPTFTPFNFLLTNMSSVSLFYGSNGWHYYLTQALPVLCTTSLPFVVHGMWLAMKIEASLSPLRIMIGCIGWTVFVYSLAGHKEWRFLHPLLPMLHVVAAKSLVSLAHDQPLAPSRAQGIGSSRTKPRRTSCLPAIRPWQAYVLLLNVPASICVVLLYMDGPVSVVRYLRSLPSEELRDGSVGFLMPCHSTPWQAYLHRKELADNGRLWALGCEPPLGNEHLSQYQDQTAVFYESPSRYLGSYFPSTVDPAFPPSRYPRSLPGTVGTGEIRWEHEWPRYLVMFGVLLEEPRVREMLIEKGYEQVWEGGTKFGEDKRRGGVKVWRFNAR